MGVFEIDVGGLTQADRALRKFGRPSRTGAHFGPSWAKAWRPKHNGAGRYADDPDGSASRFAGPVRDSAGAVFSSRVPIDSHSDRAFFIQDFHNTAQNGSAPAH